MEWTASVREGRNDLSSFFRLLKCVVRELGCMMKERDFGGEVLYA